MNSRMVQGTFDDLNPQTVGRWAYPDTGRWDAERNLREFLAAMPVWRRHGLLSFTLNLQGGSPEGYSKAQPWVNSAFETDGRLRPDYAERLRRILDFADELGMVPIVGYFYFGQDQQLADEAAVLRAVDGVTRWLLDGGWRNVLVEVNNETDVQAYDHAILRPARIHELILRVRQTQRGGRGLLAGTSYGGEGNDFFTAAALGSGAREIHGGPGDVDCGGCLWNSRGCRGGGQRWQGHFGCFLPHSHCAGLGLWQMDSNCPGGGRFSGGLFFGFYCCQQLQDHTPESEPLHFSRDWRCREHSDCGDARRSSNGRQMGGKVAECLRSDRRFVWPHRRGHGGRLSPRRRQVERPPRWI